MGTRHLVCVVKDGAYKLAQYGQWDGYPSGKGVDILAFLGRAGDVERLRANIDRVVFVDNDGVKKIYLECGGKDHGGGDISLDMTGAAKLKRLYPGISRDNSSQVLEMIANLAEGTTFSTRNQVRFAGDGLFCEWAYVIDFDQNTFEIFRGFLPPPPADAPNERFTAPALDLEKSGNSNYGPVRHVKTYPLDDLPTEETFLGDTEGKTDDEADEAA